MSKLNQINVNGTDYDIGASTFSELTDTDISNPVADQIVQFKNVGGQLKLQNVNMPGGESAANTSYDNTTSELDATNVQDALDEIVGNIPAVDQTYDSSSANAQSGAAVASAISGKADSSAIDTWTSTATVDSNNQVTFTGLNDAYGYSLYCNNGNLVGITAMEKTGSGTSVQIVFTLSNVSQGDTCKLRVLKG